MAKNNYFYDKVFDNSYELLFNRLKEGRDFQKLRESVHDRFAFPKMNKSKSPQKTLLTYYQTKMKASSDADLHSFNNENNANNQSLKVN